MDAKQRLADDAQMSLMDMVRSQRPEVMSGSDIENPAQPMCDHSELVCGDWCAKCGRPPWADEESEDSEVDDFFKRALTDLYCASEFA